MTITSLSKAYEIQLAGISIQVYTLYERQDGSCSCYKDCDCSKSKYLPAIFLGYRYQIIGNPKKYVSVKLLKRAIKDKKLAGTL